MKSKKIVEHQVGAAAADVVAIGDVFRATCAFKKIKFRNLLAM